METKTFLKFDVTAESEKRYKIKNSAFQEAVKNGKIKVYKILYIEQHWIINGDKYRGRIRKTVDSTYKSENKKPKFEHTIKYNVAKGMDYEITTDIGQHDYELLERLYPDKAVQSKMRIYVKDASGEYEKYTITVDLPKDDPDICWVEFESNTINVERENFKKPDWINEVDEKRF